MKNIIIFYLLIFLTSLSYAETNSTKCNIESNITNTYYLDILQSNISKKVLNWSTYADIKISKWLGYDELNTSCLIDTSIYQVQSKTVDSFFQNTKYIDETNDVFIRVRTDSTFQTKEKNKFRLKFRAQLPFSRCRKQLKIFVEDMSVTKNKNAINDDEGTTNIGLRYVGKERHGIKSRYSLGLSGIHPFISARYGSLFQDEKWEIEPVQTFKYSTKDYFQEETNIYFDKTFSKNDLFRFTLQRGSETTVEGMDYTFRFEYFTNAKNNKGWHFEQAFYGNTKYRHRKKEYRIINPKTEYHGINNYETIISYRANILRKWFYYEIKPSVNFHKDINYKPNYALRLFFDFYFGDYN